MNPRWEQSCIEQLSKIQKGDYQLEFPYSTDESIALENELQGLSFYVANLIHDLHRLMLIAGNLGTKETTEQVLEGIYESLIDVIPFDRMSFYRASEDKEELWVQCEWVRMKYEESFLHQGVAFKFEETFFNQSIHPYLVINDITALYLKNPEQVGLEILIREGIQSTFIIPIQPSQKHNIGYICFSSKTPNVYESLHSHLFSMISNQMVNAIQHCEDLKAINLLVEQLNIALTEAEKRSMTDFLTGIKNKGAIVELLQHELDLAFRKHHNVSILILDIDHFKAVNDTYGHLKGDDVLVSIATIIKTSIRASDVVGRIGGEEFMVVLPDTNSVGAMVVAERIRKNIEIFEHPNYAGTFRTTISIGISSTEIEMPVKDIETLMLRADSALYESKRTGRNRISIL